MAHIDPIILSRDLDAEGHSKILNVAQLTLSAAAAGVNDAVRNQEYTADVTALQNRVTAIENSAGHIDQVYVDTSSLSLAQALTAATYDAVSGYWTFGGKELSVGDIVVLTAATDQDSGRTFILNGAGNGDATDFTALGSDIDAAISAAIASVVGDAAEQFNTLGKIEDQHIALDARVTTAENDIDALESQMPLRPIHRVYTGSFVDNGDGTHTVTIPHTYNNAALQLQIQVDQGGGVWSYLSDFEVDTHASTSNITVTTSSATIAAHAIRVLATGFDVI